MPNTPTLSPGLTVRHPSRGVGKVSTVVTGLLSGKPVKAWVEFPYRTWTQKFCCYADDLTVVPPDAPKVAPTLRVVDAPLVA